MDIYNHHKFLGVSVGLCLWAGTGVLPPIIERVLGPTHADVLLWLSALSQQAGSRKDHLQQRSLLLSAHRDFIQRKLVVPSIYHPLWKEVEGIFLRKKGLRLGQ